MDPNDGQYTIAANDSKSMTDVDLTEQGSMQQKRWQTKVLIQIHLWLAMVVLLATVTLSWADQLLRVLPLTLTPGGPKEPSLLINVALWFITCSPIVKIGIFVVAFFGISTPTFCLHV
jgi:hypothetical protein